MSKYDHVDVLVVGAGPVGLMTALLLRERGLKVCVIDKEHRTNIHSYALSLHPSSQELLRSVDILDSLEAKGHRVSKTAFYSGNRREAEVALPGLGALVIPQSALESALEDRLADKGVDVLWMHELDHLDDEGGAPGIIAVVNKMQDTAMGYPVIQFQRMVAKTRHIRAGFVVGADGFRSRVRARAGVEFKPTGDRHFFSLYEGQFARDVDHAMPLEEMRVVCDDAGLAVLWPMAEGRFRWSFEIENAEAHDPTRSAMEKLLAERAPWFKIENVESIAWTALARFEDSVASRFAQGNYWLAGDAAHHGYPIGGHSLNSGIREAHEIAWRVFEILRHSAKPGTIEEYCQEGRVAWGRLVDPTAHFTAAGDAAPWTRDNLATIVRSLPLAGRNLDRALDSIGVRPRD